jgi:hypothetical protein
MSNLENDTAKVKEAPMPTVKILKKRLSMLLLPWLLALAGWIFVVVKDTVQAQVIEDVKAVHALPVTQIRIDHLEKDVDSIKKDLHEQRSDIKYLIRRFDKQYGNR